MLRFAICDDDIAYMQSIKQNICDAFDYAKTFDEKCECILYNTGEELIDKFIQDNIDIFFIDIECGAMSGFEIARQLVQKKRIRELYILQIISIIYMMHLSVVR